MSTGMNHPNYSRAERDYLEPPDDESVSEQCGTCEGFGTLFGDSEESDIECPSCDGCGFIYRSKNAIRND